MCIIAVKEKGVMMPSRDILITCFRNNNDGAGFMYNYKGKVFIEKGFMTWLDFDEALTRIEKTIKNTLKCAFVFHFRITTHGGTSKGNCHPFPISDLAYQLKKTKLITDIGVVHNGIISLTSEYGNYYYGGSSYKSTKKTETLSDTQIFIRDYLTKIQAMNENFYQDENALSLIELLIDSKMAFLDGTGDVSFVGNFNEKNKMKYSNYSYEPSRATIPVTTYSKTNNDSFCLTELTPIETTGMYWSKHKEGSFLAGQLGIDYYGMLYKIDKNNKTCYPLTLTATTVLDDDGNTIDFDKNNMFNFYDTSYDFDDQTEKAYYESQSYTNMTIYE